MAKKSPSNSAENSASQRIVRAALIAIVVAPFIVFPPFRLTSKNASVSSANAAAFSARDFATKLWTDKLIPSLRTAVDARTLYSALDASPADAAKKHARSVGIGGTSYYLVTGEGIVTAADSDGVTITLTTGEKNFVVLDTGLIFGNAVRDGTGLLDVNAFANSEEFNAIAAELNALVEASVHPSVRQLGTVGTKLRFTGIAEITSSDSDPRPLHLVPLKVEIAP